MHISLFIHAGYVIEPEEESTTTAKLSSANPEASSSKETETKGQEPKQPTQEELRLKRLAFLNQLEQKSSEASCDKDSKSESADSDRKGEECSELQTGSEEILVGGDEMQKASSITASDVAQKDAETQEKVKTETEDTKADTDSNGNWWLWSPMLIKEDM